MYSPEPRSRIFVGVEYLVGNPTLCSLPDIRLGNSLFPQGAVLMHRDAGVGCMAMDEQLLPGCVSWPFIPGWSQPSQDHWSSGAGGTYSLSLIKTQQTHLCGHLKISSSLNHTLSLLLGVCLSKVM